MYNNKQSINNIALYMRLSKDDGDKEESESITNQRKIIYDFINENFNFKHCYEYTDDGYTGANFKRPGFQKMMKDIQDKKIDLVITKNLARFRKKLYRFRRIHRKKIPKSKYKIYSYIRQSR